MRLKIQTIASEGITIKNTVLHDTCKTRTHQI